MSPTSPLLSLPGAVPAEGRDEGVAAHYGDLFREQRSLAAGQGFVDLSHRGVITVSTRCISSTTARRSGRTSNRARARRSSPTWSR
jgi:hypothetical protein